MAPKCSKYELLAVRDQSIPVNSAIDKKYKFAKKKFGNWAIGKVLVVAQCCDFNTWMSFLLFQKIFDPRLLMHYLLPKPMKNIRTMPAILPQE